MKKSCRLAASDPARHRAPARRAAPQGLSPKGLTLLVLTLALIMPSTVLSAAQAAVVLTYQAVNPASGASFLSTSLSEANDAAKFGFTEVAPAFKAETASAAGRSPVNRFYRGGDFVTETMPDRKQALVEAGYVDQGVRFYAQTTQVEGTEPVRRFERSGKHQYAITPSVQSSLRSAGWTDEGISFYAPPLTKDLAEFTGAHTDGKFSFAVFPDTQQETKTWSGDQYAKRTKYVADRRISKDLRWLIGTGDHVAWGAAEPESPAPEQWGIIDTGMKTLDGQLPYLLTAGNHDTAIVCAGGSACPSVVGNRPLQDVAFRDTHVLNHYFPLNTRIQANGSFEGKIENSYRVFRAEGKDWLVLALESAPRRDALNWAKNVVATHPTTNVIVFSHYLINPDGSKGNMGYGSLSSQAVYDELLLNYPNVRMAFAGHVGYTFQRMDTGRSGNKVLTVVSTFHANDYNPTRFVTINVDDNSVSTNVEAASVRAEVLKNNPSATVPDYSAYSWNHTGMNFVSP